MLEVLIGIGLLCVTRTPVVGGQRVLFVIDAAEDVIVLGALT